MTDFTGSDTWRTTITGPSTAEAVTAASVCDMGVLQADREVWLYNRVVGRSTAVEIDASPEGTSEAPADIFDLKAITSWTTVSTVTHTTTAAAQPGDIIRGTIVCHVRSTRIRAGYVGLRPRVTVDVDGSPAIATAFRRRFLGAAGAHTIHTTPVSLEFLALMPALTDGVVTVDLQAICTTLPDVSDDIYIQSPWEVFVEILRPVAAP